MLRKCEQIIKFFINNSTFFKEDGIGENDDLLPPNKMRYWYGAVLCGGNSSVFMV